MAFKRQADRAGLTIERFIAEYAVSWLIAFEGDSDINPVTGEFIRSYIMGSS